MERIEKTVFISYRRTNISWALAIFQNLTNHGYDVFLDYKGIASGDFERVILENITARAHFLVLLTPSALERCNEPDDWLRREMETALNTQRNIVPVMLEGFDFGTPKIANQLTGTLAAFKTYNAIRIPADYFDEAMERLCGRYLNVPLTAVLHPVSLDAKRAAAEQIEAAERAPRVQESELSAQQWFERASHAADAKEEEQFYSEAIRLKPDYLDAYKDRAFVREQNDNLEGAIADYSEAIQLKPDDANSYHDRASAREQDGDFEGAIRDYSEAIRLKPDDAEAYINRAFARGQDGDLNGAIKDYSEAILLKPDDGGIFDLRGCAREQNGDLNGAIKDHSEAIRLKPDDADLYYNRAFAREQGGDFEGAIKDYSEAIRLRPNFDTGFYDRGIAREESGDLEGAIKDYSEAIRLDPHYVIAFNRRGLARHASGDFEGAIQDYSEAIQLNPDNVIAFQNRGAARKANGDFEGADEDFNQAECLEAAAED